MKKHFLKVRAEDREIFDQLASGIKKIETRAATVRNKGIVPGDILTFSCGSDTLELQVRNATIFKSISKMLKKYSVQDIAPNFSTEKELETLYASFPGYIEKIKLNGIIALEL